MTSMTMARVPATQANGRSGTALWCCVSVVSCGLCGRRGLCVRVSDCWRVCGRVFGQKAQVVSAICCNLQPQLVGPNETAK